MAVRIKHTLPYKQNPSLDTPGIVPAATKAPLTAGLVPLFPAVAQVCPLSAAASCAFPTAGRANRCTTAHCNGPTPVGSMLMFLQLHMIWACRGAYTARLAGVV